MNENFKSIRDDDTSCCKKKKQKWNLQIFQHENIFNLLFSSAIKSIIRNRCQVTRNSNQNFTVLKYDFVLFLSFDRSPNFLEREKSEKKNYSEEKDMLYFTLCLCLSHNSFFQFEQIWFLFNNNEVEEENNDFKISLNEEKRETKRQKTKFNDKTVFNIKIETCFRVF